MTIDSLQILFFAGAALGFAMVIYLYSQVIAIKVKEEKLQK